MESLPVELIKFHFRYLIDEYGFSIVDEEYFPEMMGNAIVVYESATSGIMVVIDRSQVLINVGKPSWPHRYWFEFSDVIQFFIPEIKEAYVFVNEDSPKNRIEIEVQINRLALLLRQYCEPLLRGDFSMHDKIREIETKRVEELLEHLKSLSKKGRNNSNHL